MMIIKIINNNTAIQAVTESATQAMQWASQPASNKVIEQLGILKYCGKLTLSSVFSMPVNAADVEWEKCDHKVHPHSIA